MVHTPYDNALCLCVFRYEIFEYGYGLLKMLMFDEKSLYVLRLERSVLFR